MWKYDPDQMHQYLEDWARLERDFSDRLSDAWEVTARIAQRLRMDMERIARAREIRNRAAHLDRKLTADEIAQSRRVLDEALMRYLSVDVLDQRRASDEARWIMELRARRTDRHHYLVEYTRLFKKVRTFDRVDGDIRQIISETDFMYCRGIRDDISHPAPPPSDDDVRRALGIIHIIRASMAKPRIQSSPPPATRAQPPVADVQLQDTADSGLDTASRFESPAPQFRPTTERDDVPRAHNVPDSVLRATQSAKPRTPAAKLPSITTSALADDIGRPLNDILATMAYLWPKLIWTPASALGPQRVILIRQALDGLREAPHATPQAEPLHGRITARTIAGDTGHTVDETLATMRDLWPNIPWTDSTPLVHNEIRELRSRLSGGPLRKQQATYWVPPDGSTRITARTIAGDTGHTVEETLATIRQLWPSIPWDADTPLDPQRVRLTRKHLTEGQPVLTAEQVSSTTPRSLSKATGRTIEDIITTLTRLWPQATWTADTPLDPHRVMAIGNRVPRAHNVPNSVLRATQSAKPRTPAAKLPSITASALADDIGRPLNDILAAMSYLWPKIIWTPNTPLGPQRVLLIRKHLAEVQRVLTAEQVTSTTPASLSKATGRTIEDIITTLTRLWPQATWTADTPLDPHRVMAIGNHVGGPATTNRRQRRKLMQQGQPLPQPSASRPAAITATELAGDTGRTVGDILAAMSYLWPKIIWTPNTPLGPQRVLLIREHLARFPGLSEPGVTATKPRLQDWRRSARFRRRPGRSQSSSD